MMHMKQGRHWWQQRLTLQLRLAIWTGGLIVICSLSLVLFINVIASIVLSNRAPGNLPSIDPAATDMAPLTAIPSSPAPMPKASLSPPPHATPAATRPADTTLQALLRDVRIISLVGLIFIACLGSASAYLLAGMALRPLHQINQTVKQISAGTLDRRLRLDGPHDELYELAGAFNAMLDRLKQGFEQQGRFIADAAHELRTPLAALRTSVEVVQSNSQATVDEYRAMTATLERALIRLERLVGNLLILASSDERITGDTVELGPLVEEVLFDLQPLADAQDVTVRLLGEAETTAQGDATLLSHVFRNLIENAIHYNRPGGEVIVTLQQDEGWAVVEVADTGIGIATEEQTHLFERFYRVDRSRSRHLGGAGLGLSIVAHLVQKHGGHIQVSSTLGVGSRFTVRLPR
jgi:Signal transduction histidine kinase